MGGERVGGLSGGGGCVGWSSDVDFVVSLLWLDAVGVMVRDFGVLNVSTALLVRVGPIVTDWEGWWEGRSGMKGTVAVGRLLLFW